MHGKLRPSPLTEKRIFAAFFSILKARFLTDRDAAF
jgi:hypothetical protein